MSKKSDNRITINYKEKEYEIENKKDEQKVKPKNGKDTDKEITVKDYEEGGFFTSHKCKCSEDGTNFETIDIKWGAKKHITIWGGGSIGLALVAFIIYYFGFRPKKETELPEGLKE